MTGPVAYLTGEYPRATDTFIQREVAALRDLGLDIQTCSIRATDIFHHVGFEQQAEHARTFQVQTNAKKPARLIGAHLSLLRRPSRWFAAVRLALATRPPGLKATLWQLFYFLQAGVLAQHLSRIGARHLHNHFGNSSCSVAMLAAEMAGLTYSYTMHGPMEFFAPEYWRIDEKIARAKFVACISHFARAQGMIFADQAHWPKMHIVHCGVAPSLYESAPDRTEQGSEIVFVGRLAAIKGVALLIDAVGQLIKKHPDLHLTLVGDGSERGALEAQVRRLSLSTSVTFTGYLNQQEVAARLSEADIFALPSFAEGVPVVLMEAMATRRPVIAPRVAGVPELVEDGVSGFCVPPGDLMTLKDRLQTLICNPELRTSMGTAGRARVKAEFDVTSEAKKLAVLFGLEETLPTKVKINK